jgi:hypothetical protein
MTKKISEKEVATVFSKLGLGSNSPNQVVLAGNVFDKYGNYCFPTATNCDFSNVAVSNCCQSPFLSINNN